MRATITLSCGGPDPDRLDVHLATIPLVAPGVDAMPWRQQLDRLGPAIRRGLPLPVRAAAAWRAYRQHGARMAAAERN